MSRNVNDNSNSTSAASGVTLAIVGTFLFALKSIFIKLAFAAGADVALLLTLRLAFSFPIYLGVWIYLRRDTQDRREISRSMVVQAVVLGFWGYYLASFLDLSGLAYISAQLERITLYSYPVMIAVLAWMFLGEAFNLRIVAALTLCYAGIIVMFVKEQTLTNGTHTGLGVLLVVASAASYSFYILLAKPAMLKIGSREFTSLAMMGSGLFITIHFLCTQSPRSILEAPAEVYMYGVLLALVCTVLPSYMINESIVRIGATRATVIGTVGPVMTMLLAITLLGEPSSIQHFIGMSIAVFGVTLVAIR